LDTSFASRQKKYPAFTKLFIEKRRSDDAEWQMGNLSEVDIFFGGV
jgi:hypothetical protein